MRTVRVFSLALIALSVPVLGTGCMTAYKRSVGADTQRVFSRVYATDFNLAWQAVLDALKSSRLDVSNRESGTIQTRWQDNTAEKNFTDGDGTTSIYMKAQYRFKISLSRGFYKARPAIKIAVQREQVVQRDALEDFRPVESDSIEENTLLYRIGRLINVRTRIAKLEEMRVNAEIQNSNFGPVPSPGMDGESPLDSSPEMTPDSTFEEMPAPSPENGAPEGESPPSEDLAL